LPNVVVATARLRWPRRLATDLVWRVAKPPAAEAPCPKAALVRIPELIMSIGDTEDDTGTSGLGYARSGGVATPIGIPVRTECSCTWRSTRACRSMLAPVTGANDRVRRFSRFVLADCVRFVRFNMAKALTSA